MAPPRPFRSVITHSTVPAYQGEVTEKLDVPQWGDMSVSRRKMLPADGPFSYPFVLSAHGTLLLIPEWEWDTGVGVLLGEEYRLLVKPLLIRESDGKVRERHTFTMTFKRNGFRLELVMDGDVQQEIAPAIHWPNGGQVEYRGMVDANELLQILDQVLGQRAPMGGIRWS